MLDPRYFRVLAGDAVVAQQRAELEALPDRGTSLTAWQEAQHRADIRGVEVVESAYGWSVRAASGLDDFALLASVRRGNVDGTWAAAEAFAVAWVAEDPARRFAFTRKPL